MVKSASFEHNIRIKYTFYKLLFKQKYKHNALYKHKEKNNIKKIEYYKK